MSADHIFLKVHKLKLKQVLQRSPLVLMVDSASPRYNRTLKCHPLVLPYCQFNPQLTIFGLVGLYKTLKENNFIASSARSFSPGSSNWQNLDKCKFEVSRVCHHSYTNFKQFIAASVPCLNPYEIICNSCNPKYFCNLA